MGKVTRHIKIKVYSEIPMSYIRYCWSHEIKVKDIVTWVDGVPYDVSYVNGMKK